MSELEKNETDKELEITKDLLDVDFEELPISRASEKITVKGVEFDPAIHKTNPDGSPMLGSKNQFLLKKEAKKSAFRKVTDFLGISENEEKAGISPENKQFNPALEGEKLEKERLEQISKERFEKDLASSAASSADLYFMSGTLLLGVEFLNQREQFFEPVCGIFAEYERRTGRKVDLPPGVALAFGLGRISWEIAKREPECKARLDAGLQVVRNNSATYLKGLVPFLGKKQKKIEKDDKKKTTEKEEVSNDKI